MTLKDQLIAVLRSRKFWALLLSIAGTAVAYTYGKIDAQTAILAGIGAAGAYMVGTGLEGPAVPPQTQPGVTVVPPDSKVVFTLPNAPKP